MSLRVSVDELESMPFRIKKFDYNRYRIDHPKIQGVLYLGNIVTRAKRVPDSLIPPGTAPRDGLAVVLAYQSIVSFISSGERHSPSKSVTPKAAREEITDYILNEEVYEPWNEYIVGSADPRLVKTRTILLKLEWAVDCYNSSGEPYVMANHNTSHSVSTATVPESGMR